MLGKHCNHDAPQTPWLAVEAETSSPFPTPRRHRRLRLGAFGASDVDAFGVTTFPTRPSSLAMPSGSAPVSSCLFSEPKMHHNAGFCIIKIISEVRDRRSPNSRGGGRLLPHPLLCSPPPPKAGAPPLRLGWLRPCAAMCHLATSHNNVTCLPVAYSHNGQVRWVMTSNG